jgi:FAD/FMN-containing dehydrogenase
MEHLDARYIKAVHYTTKANRAELPKMVLLIDISAHHQSSESYTSQLLDMLVQACRERT